MRRVPPSKKKSSEKGDPSHGDFFCNVEVRRGDPSHGDFFVMLK